MIENLRVRLWIIGIVMVGAAIWVAPNFMNVENKWWPTKDKMVLGLDIQGGSHLVLRVDVDSAVKQDVQRMTTTLKNELKDEKVEVKSITMTDAATGAMQIDLNTPSDEAAVRALLDKSYGNVLKVDGAKDGKVDISYNELHLRDFKKRLLEQAISTIRNRIDEFGVSEPSISAQGTDRILVQLPGIKDATNAKELINKTARLDFMMVSTEQPKEDLQKMIADAEKEGNFKLAGMKYTQYVDKLNEALKTKLPENTIIYFEKDESAQNIEVGRRPFLLKTNELVTGDRLTDASVSQDQYGKPEVLFRFDPVGAREFGEMTKKNVNKSMAIVLDKVVKSAPNIREPITGGRGSITMGGSGRDANNTFKEAQLISMALRAGALPAALEQLEERTVGPSLGADAIAKGRFAAIISALVVFIVMVIYYKSFGIIADLSLAFNVLITLAILSALGATLTLPGVAGMALAVAIAVDANVIIYERVKEEMRKGAGLAVGIREGYERAFSSIFDANVTAIAVCVVLMYYGTGPVRGFAVTLLCSLVTSMFTAVFFTKAVLDLIVGRWKWKLAV